MSSLEELRARLHRTSPDTSMRTMLLEHGDDGSKVRVVSHLAYFTSDEGAANFSAYVLEAGFRIEKSPEKDAVAFSGESAVVGGEFDEAVQRLKEKAEELEGQYDGWGCSVVLD